MAQQTQTSEKKPIPWTLIAAGFVVLLVFTFIMENDELVEVNFLFGILSATMSSALLIFVSLSIGALIVYLIMLPKVLRKRYDTRQLERDLDHCKKQQEQLQKELRSSKSDNS